MTDETNKLGQDVAILAAMAQEMEAYLQSEVLFWQMSAPGMPKLTIGGYLLRQHRLLALRDLLSEEQEARVQAAAVAFNTVLVDKIVRYEQKAHRELEARLRQWAEYLQDVDQGIASSSSNYSTAVEVRAMIEAIMVQMQLPPYQLEERMTRQLALLDNRLRLVWESGDFVWPENWQPAYPRQAYWWLYGHPREKVRR